MRDALIHFLDRIKDYEHESGHTMHEDERESSDIVDIHLEAVPELKNYVFISNVSESLVAGCHYWVKVDDDSEYKPATVREMYKDRSMYFCLTNGSVKECRFVMDYKPLNFN